MKKIIRLTESDLHKLVKESVNRILAESTYSKRGRQQAISVGRRTIRGCVPDPIIERYVREFEEKYLRGCSDYLYKFLPKFVEIAFKDRDAYQRAGSAILDLNYLSRSKDTLNNQEIRSEFEKINNAKTADDLENIRNVIQSLIDSRWGEKEDEDPWQKRYPNGDLDY